jgi:hypothetical protein
MPEKLQNVCRHQTSGVLFQKLDLGCSPSIVSIKRAALVLPSQFNLELNWLVFVGIETTVPAFRVQTKSRFQQLTEFL